MRRDAHRDDGKRFVVRPDEMLTAFLELERVPRESLSLPKCRMTGTIRAVHLLIAPSPGEGQEIDCKMQSNSR